jgi:hypothetical protein
MRLFVTAAKAEQEPGVTFRTPLTATLADRMGEDDMAGEDPQSGLKFCQHPKQKRAFD